MGSAPSTSQLVQLVLEPKHDAQGLLHVWQTPRPTFESRYEPSAHAEVHVLAEGSKTAPG